MDPDDREAAGVRYEVIRAGLIRIFISKGFSDAEDLADDTIGRVVGKLPEIKEHYAGEKVRYFHGVARNVILEARRRKEVATGTLPEPASQIERTSDKYDCLLECLKAMPHEKRELILDYYLYQGGTSIRHHRQMAAALGISVGALRTRAHHIRNALEKCILQCEGLLSKRKAPRLSLLLGGRVSDVNEEG